MAMEAKEEYILFMAAIYSSGVCYYDWSRDMGKVWRGNISYKNRFPTVEAAREKLEKLKEEGVFTAAKGLYVCMERGEENLAKFVSEILRNGAGNKEVFIARVPDECYVGSYWKKVLDTEGCTYYTNDRNRFLRSCKNFVKEYSIKEGTVTFTTRIEEAAFFNEKEASEAKEELNGVWKNGISIGFMPLHLPFPPKYGKWDKVYAFNTGKRITSHTVDDIVPARITPSKYDGRTPGLQYTYRITENPFCQDPMESDLHTLEGLKAMGVEIISPTEATYKGERWAIEEGKCLRP